MEEITKITSVNLTKFNTEEYTQYLNDIVKLVENAGLDTFKIKADFFEAFKENIQRLKDISRQSRISKETKELNALNTERNSLVQYILSIFRTEKKSPVEARKKAAEILYDVTKKYIGTQYTSSRRKIIIIEGLLLDLHKSENKKYIETLSLVEAVNKLEEVNTKYNELKNERAENQIANNLGNTKEVRTITDKQYEIIESRVFAINVISPTEETKKIITSINKLIADSITAYKQRTNRNKVA
ncbi:MAG: DUF6261 family protein [Capnocytophaga sp.]|nr:DUF6261 family protein [Capnocytophaga sp.]